MIYKEENRSGQQRANEHGRSGKKPDLLLMVRRGNGL